MRRVILLLVLATLGAGWYGVAGSSTALAVNGSSVSESAYRSELRALSANPGLYCYVSSLAQTAMAQPGAGRDAVSASGAAAWANLRVEGIAVDHYVRSHLHYHATSADLATATSALEGELAQAATQTSNACPGTAAQALAEMPAEMRAAEVEDQASSMYLVSTLNATVALTPANIKKYYTAHQSSYDTLCVSVAVVPQTSLAAFAASQRAGLSMAALAKRYSLDPSASKGGAYGCYPPTSTSFASVRGFVGTTPVGHFPTTPQPYTPSGSSTTYGLYVGATSKTVSSFAAAEAVVISDIQKANATTANAVKSSILYRAAVAVDPVYGRWGLTSSGPSVFAPGLPRESGPATTSQLTTASTTPYQ